MRDEPEKTEIIPVKNYKKGTVKLFRLVPGKFVGLLRHQTIKYTVPLCYLERQQRKISPKGTGPFAAFGEIATPLANNRISG